MRQNFLIAITALAAIVAFSPHAAALGSAAHPHVHEWYGTSASSALVNVDYSSDAGSLQANLGSDTSLIGACVDAAPLGTLFPLPPAITPGDGDPETGVGAACFSYTTVYGDDTGTTQTVNLDSTVGSFAPIFAVCVDNNGDGICQAGVDETNLCWTGPTAEGGISLNPGGGACTIYLNPSAANPTVYVNVLAAINLDTGATVTGGGVHGFAYYA